MMVQPTPWRANDLRRESTTAAVAPDRFQFDLSALRALRGRWGYVSAAAGSLVTLALLFEPWLSASGFDGSIGINAFGRMEITTSALNAWSQSPPAAVRVTGAWGILTAATGILTVCFVVFDLRARSRTLSRLVMLSTLASAGWVLITLVYLNTKGPEAKAMVGVSRDLGGQLGLVMRAYFGNGAYVLPGSRVSAYANAGLTPWAWAAGAVSLISACAVVAQWVRDHTKHTTT
ncbi:hypothetical protein [Nocardia sp. N2S4-5]|uniref:hypothetical protein n=1 Tax=Nocardia sp. N2S4-5 TaxID=3351565 RepID=UPI0037D2D6E7